MRYDAEHKEETHRRILDEASVLVRRLGLAGSSVERVMRAAGLTVGGFYAHFASKEAFTGEIVSWVFRQGRERLLEGLGELSGAALLGTIAKKYLSRAHRDMIDTGCPMPSTLSEIGRAGGPARRALTEAIGALVRDLAERVPGDDAAERRGRVIATLALCYGGLALARAVDDEKLSHEILKACRAAATTREP